MCACVRAHESVFVCCVCMCGSLVCVAADDATQWPMTSACLSVGWLVGLKPPCSSQRINYDCSAAVFGGQASQSWEEVFKLRQANRRVV